MFLKHVFIAALYCAMLWSTGPAAAAALTPEMSAEQVAREAYARMRAGDWAAAAETFDPAALKQFRGMVGPLLERPVGEGVLGMFHDDGKLSADTGKMSDAEFFAGFVRGLMLGSGANLNGQDILGAVPEGPDRMHLVTRSSVEAMGIHLTQVEVVTLNRTPQGWRLALNGKLDGMAQALRQASETRPSSPPTSEP
jgi:hypothetical protein